MSPPKSHEIAMKSPENRSKPAYFWGETWRNGLSSVCPSPGLRVYGVGLMSMRLYDWA